LNTGIFTDFREILHENIGTKRSESDIRPTPYSHFVTCWCMWWIPCRRCTDLPECSISRN